MSTGATEGPGPLLTSRLGYLLKHAQQRLARRTAAALAPYGLDGRDLAVLLVVADTGPASQQQAARRLGVDRTSMVGFLDALERKGLVTRHPDAADRRRNVVDVTPAGRDLLARALRASDDAERRFLAPLAEREAGRLKEALLAVIEQDGGEEEAAEAGR